MSVIFALLAVAQAAVPPPSPPLLPAPQSVSDGIDAILMTDVLEPMLRQMVGQGIDIAYRRRLENEPAAEAALPGLHSEMLHAARAAGNAVVEQEAREAKTAAHALLTTSLKASQIRMLGDLYRPFVSANLNLEFRMRPDDPSMSAAAERWSSLLVKDAGYDARARAAFASPEAKEAATIAGPIVERYRSELMGTAASAMKAAMTAAKARANDLATSKGLSPIYPGDPK